MQDRLSPQLSFNSCLNRIQAVGGQMQQKKSADKPADSPADSPAAVSDVTRKLGKVESHLQGVFRGDTRTRTTCMLNVQQNSSTKVDGYCR